MKSFQKKSVALLMAVIIIVGIVLSVRLVYLMVNKSEHYQIMARELHERERSIKAKRGQILDRNGNVLAGNVSVSTISVIHSQINEPEKVVNVLSKELGIDKKKIEKLVSKVSIREKIKQNVPKSVSDKIREYNLAGVMIDEDYKRYYPYGELASHVLGFTGADNQGIIGLEVEYDKILAGKEGAILTLTNAAGIEIQGKAEDRIEPVDGKNLTTTLDVNIQQYAKQLAQNAMEQKAAKRVSIIVMNPKDGQIYAMTNEPEFNPEDPWGSGETDMNKLNDLWRNPCVSDTYEPGSTFKIITAAAALEEGVATVNDSFFCPGHITVGGRKIRCHKVTGHGSENFVQGVMNSCNPVFVTLGERLGADRFFKYIREYGITEKTGIDLPGEAGAVIHKIEDVHEVELATMSFGQSFQITPIRLLTSVSEIINGGNKITPHLNINLDENGAAATIVNKNTSDTLNSILESVVSEGTGKNAFVSGFHVGGKTGTSEKLPRGNGLYTASCLGFAPAYDPQVIAIVIIDEPKGLYYGGTIAAPVIGELFDNILPYLGILEDKKEDKENEQSY